MQPCSQPRYGLMLTSKPTSGLWFRASAERVVSLRKRVRGSGASSSSKPDSGSGSNAARSKRFGGADWVPRPRMGSRYRAIGGSASLGEHQAKVHRPKHLKEPLDRVGSQPTEDPMSELLYEK